MTSFVSSVARRSAVQSITRSMSAFESAALPAISGWLPVPATFEEAFALGGASLKAWFQHYTGPRIPLVDQVGDVAIASQAAADALAGKRVIGQITITSSNITLRDVLVKWPDGEGPSSTEYLIDWDTALTNVTVEYCELDGNSKMWVAGIGGSSSSTGILIQYVDIHHTGTDQVRTHKNSTYWRNYNHDWRAWNADSDGEFDSDVHPHADGYQVLRSGNTIEECWVEVPNGVDGFGSAAIMCSQSTQETIIGLTVNRCYLDGGGKVVHTYPTHLDVNSPGPLGYPEQITYTDNLFGRKYRNAGSPFTEVGMPNANGDLITRSGNVYDDTREAVPLPPSVARPAQLVNNGNFADPVEAAENWPNKTAGDGTIDVTGGDLELGRSASSSGRSCRLIDTVIGESYDFGYRYTKSTINMTAYVGISTSGVGGAISTVTRSASGLYVTTFIATQSKHALWFVTGTGSAGNVINIDDVSCTLTP